MYEIELKVRADHDRVRGALDDRGAGRVGRIRQIDTYYDAPHRDFAESDEALRIRRELDLDARNDEADLPSDPRDGADDPESTSGWETTKLTYKGPLVESASKTREEHETVVADPDATAGILDGLGFDPAATVEKEREFFRIGEYTVALDEVSGLGEFCEVEAAGEAADVERLREGAVEVLADVGLDAADQIRTSYLGLLLESDADEEA